MWHKVKNPAQLSNLVEKVIRDLNLRCSSVAHCPLLSPPEVVVDLVPRTLLIFWPHTKSIISEGYSKSLSDLALGMATDVLRRLTDALPSEAKVDFSEAT